MALFFQSHPDVIIGGNTFRNVPTILQVEDTPLLEVDEFANAGYGLRFPVYNRDGVKVAVIAGNQIHLTEEGRKSNIKPRFEPNLTVCEVNGRSILELRRKDAAALHGWAELYAPGGVLIRAHDSGVSGLLRDGNALAMGDRVMMGAVFDGCKIGIHAHKTGIGLGVGGGSIYIGYLGAPGGAGLNPPAPPEA